MIAYKPSTLLPCGSMGHAICPDFRDPDRSRAPRALSRWASVATTRQIPENLPCGSMGHAICPDFPAEKKEQTENRKPTHPRNNTPEKQHTRETNGKDPLRKFSSPGKFPEIFREIFRNFPRTEIFLALEANRSPRFLAGRPCGTAGHSLRAAALSFSGAFGQTGLVQSAPKADQSA